MTAVDLDVCTTEIRRGADAFAGLGAQWDDLAGRCRAATPFQAYAWLESWWQAYGRPGQLRLVLVRRGGRLIAAAPLRLRRRAGLSVLTPLGDPFSDFTDVLVDDAFAGPAAAALAGCLVAEPDWQVIDFPEARPGSVAGGALWQAWPGRRRRTAASLCLELPASSMEELVKELPQHSRKTVKRRLNQLRKAQPEIREVPAAVAAGALDELLRLHAEQWQGRGVNTEHLSDAFAGHLRRAVPAMISTGQAALFEYRFDGRLMASSLVLIGGDLVGGYLYGADPALRERVDVTTMLLADTLPLADRLGRATMSMLRGAEPHKERWRPREAPNTRILLTRPGSPGGALYAAGVQAERRTRAFAKQRAPWLRTVRDRLRERAARS
jgi:CelD/BcsL family acetyltransferase involved in cellulose biosynthesis